jgi:signal recognition particle subunit SEC65
MRPQMVVHEKPRTEEVSSASRALPVEEKHKDMCYPRNPSKNGDEGAQNE